MKPTPLIISCINDIRLKIILSLIFSGLNKLIIKEIDALRK